LRLGGCRLRASTQQHGRSGKVLGHLPEEWRCVGVGVGVRDSVGSSIVVGLRRARLWRRCAAARLIHSRSALTQVTIPLVRLALHKNVLRRALIVIPIMGLALHRHALCKLSLARPGFHVELLEKRVQLLVELASRLRELIELRTSLVVGIAVARSQF
jgi:hypothetical protein